MIKLRKHLEKLRLVKRKKYHPIIHKIRKKYRISRKTLFYVKEYGPRTNVPKTIIKESIKILLLASILSSIGGSALENIRAIFIALTPLLILLPVLNGMIGNYGTIISSRFSTMLYTGKIRGDWHKNRKLRELYIQIAIISVIMAFLAASMAMAISGMSGFGLSAEIGYKIFAIAILDVVILVSLLFLVAVVAGLHFYRKNEDPDNFLIPITTSIADFGNMLILAALVFMFF